MKHAVGALAVLAAGAGTAWAQEERGPRQEFERRMRDLEERFRAQREQLEREFRERHPGRPEPERPGADNHALLRQILERLERLERKLDGARPKFQFDFKDLERRFQGARAPKLDFERLERRFEGMRPDLERLIPRFRRYFDKDGDFDFEFRVEPRKKGPPGPEKKAEKRAEEKGGKKPDRKDREDDDEDRPRKKKEGF